MNRDPFDTLRSRNPIPPESLPEPPTAVASRIASDRPSLRRGLAIAVAAAVVVLVAGGGWLLWNRTGGRPQVVGPTTTTIGATTTTAEGVVELAAYFFRDGALLPVAGAVEVLNGEPGPDLAASALDLLLSGPRDLTGFPSSGASGQFEAGLTSAIPEGTEVLGLTLADGIAAVDFSAEFAEASPWAICQVVYTLTRLDGVAEVAFSIEGVPQVATTQASGLFVPELAPRGTVAGLDTLSRDTLSPYLPAVMIENPPFGGTLSASEAVLLRSDDSTSDARLTLSAPDGTLLWSAWAPPGAEAPTLPSEVIESLGAVGYWATLLVEAQGANGAVLASSTIPVWLEPGPPSAATTTTMGEVDDAPTVVVYFLDATTGAPVPVARDLRVLNVNPLPDLGPLTVELLLAGPGAWDAAPLDPPVAAAEARLTSAIPEETTLAAFDLTDGTATVDLSAEFLGGDPATQGARFAQLVFTLTRLEGVQSVRVLVAGSPASPLDGEPGPLTWQDVDALLPPGVIAYPPLGGTLHLPDIIVAASGRLTLTLIDEGGTALWTATVVGGTDCCAAAAVPADLVGYGRWVTLQATGPEGGAAGAAFEMPVWLEPASPTVTTTVAATTTTPFGLDLRPFPEDTLTGCATDTSHDLADFEAALTEGRRDLADLCSVLGVPDYETGSGLYIPVYTLADGGLLYLGYTAPWGEGLIYAKVLSPDGTARDLLEG